MRLSASVLVVVVAAIALLCTVSLAASVAGDDAASNEIEYLDSLSNELDLDEHDGEDLRDLEDALYRMKLTGNLKDKVKKAAKKVKKTGKKVVKKTKDTAKTAKDKTKSAAKTVKDKTSNAGKKIKDGATKAGKKIKDGAEKAGKKIKDGAEKIGEKFKEGFELTESIIKAGVEKLKTLGTKAFDKVKDEVESLLPDKLKFLGELFTNPAEFAKKATNCDKPIFGKGQHGCIASFILQKFQPQTITSRSFLQMGEVVELVSNSAASTSAEASATWNWANWEDNANGYVPYDDMPYYHKYLCNKDLKAVDGRWDFTSSCNSTSYGGTSSFSISRVQMNDNSCVDCQCKSNSQAAEILTAFNDVLTSALVTYESFTDIARGIQLVGVIIGTSLRIVASGLRSECIRFGLNQ